MKAFREIRNYPSDFMVWYSAYSHICFTSHWHGEIELIYVEEGSVSLHINNESFLAHAGDLIICDSGNIHYCDYCSDDSRLIFLIFDSRLISSRYQYTQFETPLLTKDALEQYGLTAALHSLFQLVSLELKERREHYQPIVQASLKGFWYLLLRYIPCGTQSEYMLNKRLLQLSEFQRLLSHLEENYAENLTLEAMAETMNFSPSHFSKVFKQLTGTNFVKYLNQIRIANATELLLNSPSKITTVAFDCGFNNIRSFNRTFKDLTGYSPSDFLALPKGKTSDFFAFKSNASVPAYEDIDPITIIVPK